MGYSEDNKNAANENKLSTKGMKYERSCTDIICCLVFTIFIVAMIGVSGFAISTGDPKKILTPFDSDGNLCGMPDQTLSNSTQNVKRDFTEYKFKYFTGLNSLASGSEALKNPRLFDAVCVKECPSAIPQSQSLDITKRQDCMVNDDVTECPNYASPFINTTVLYSYCMPDTNNAEAAVKELYKQMNASLGFGNYINDIKLAWQVLVIMGIGTFIVTLIYVWLLKIITKPLLYVSLLLIFVLGVASGYWAYKETVKIEDKTSSDYKVAMGGSIIIWIIVVLYTVFICCFWKSIALGASIMEASSEFITENKKIFFLPIIAYILCLPVVFWWTITSIFIYGLGTPKYDEYNFVAEVEGTQMSDGMFIFFLFGLFWIVAFLIAVQIFSTSATTCLWYFTGHGSDDTSMQGQYSVWMAVKWALSYHLGSIAFGSFLIAVVTMLRVICEYIIYQYEKAGGADKDNAIWKVIKCCVRGALKCLDCCVKFINKNAYIQIALHNSNFCTAAKESFYLNLRNGGRFSAVAMIGSILSVLGKGTIVATCFFLTILLVDAMYPAIKQPYLPAMIIGFFAYLISGIFLSLFQDSALAILHCFCLDEEQGGSVNTPDSLKGFLDMADEQAKMQEADRQVKPNKVE